MSKKFDADDLSFLTEYDMEYFTATESEKEKMLYSYTAMLRGPKSYVKSRTQDMENEYRRLSKINLRSDVNRDLRIALLKQEISSNEMDKQRRIKDKDSIEEIIFLLDAETSKHKTELEELEVKNAQG